MDVSCLGVQKWSGPAGGILSSYLDVTCGAIFLCGIEFLDSMKLSASPQRKTIDGILATPPALTVWDRLIVVPGLELIERRDPRTEMELRRDCGSYVVDTLGLTYQDLFLITHTDRPSRNYREVPALQKGALVAYYTPSDDLRERHFGIGQDAELVISKWNIGHVFRHPVGLVEGMYTDVRFFLSLDR
jgi:hypothetical protein